MSDEKIGLGSLVNDLYLVQEGDTLTGIALKYNININHLKRINNLTSTIVYPGQVLKVKLPTRPSMIERCESPDIVLEDELVEVISEPISQTNGESISQPASQPPASPTVIPPVKASTGSLSKYISSFFWKTPYNTVPPSSPGKEVAEEILPHPSTSPTDILDFEKDVEEIDEIVKEDFPSERSIDSLRVLDKEFDAEVVGVEITSPASQPEVTKSEERIPVLLGDGKILSTSQIIKLAKYLPIVIQDHFWVLLYSVYRDGADFTTFFSRTRGHNMTLVVVEANNGEIFGGLASERWQVSSKYYGSGNSFLFQIVNDEVIVYPWTMENDFIMWSNAQRIAMGGGGDGFGFVLDDDFLTGQSNTSSAFGNPPLTSYRGSFRVTNVEVWGFESVIGKKATTKIK